MAPRRPPSAALLAVGATALVAELAAQPAGAEANRLVLELRPPRTRPRLPRAKPASAAHPHSPALRKLKLVHEKHHLADMSTADNAQYSLEGIIGTSCQTSMARGEEEQTLKLLPDTGSSDFWVYGVNCIDCRKKGTNSFQAESSCSANYTGRRATLGYKDGTRVSGPVFTEVIQVGGMLVPMEQVIVVDEVGRRDDYFPSDGTLGLAPTSLLHTDADTFLASLFRTHPELPKQFSFHLSRMPSSSSHLLFGDVDLALYSKENAFQYGGNPSTDGREWAVSLTSLAWVGTDVEGLQVRGAGERVAALVDSGTSLIALSADIYDVLLPELIWRLGSCRFDNDHGVLECDCPSLGDMNLLPWLSVTVLDESSRPFDLRLSPSEYVEATFDREKPWRRICIPCFSRDESAIYPVILGMSFLRSFYTVFNVENRSVGFARSVDSPLPAARELQQVQMHMARVLWMMAFSMTLFSSAFACYVLFDRDPQGLLSLRSSEARSWKNLDLSKVQPLQVDIGVVKEKKLLAHREGMVPLIRMMSAEDYDANMFSARIALSPRSPRGGAPASARSASAPKSPNDGRPISARSLYGPSPEAQLVSTPRGVMVLSKMAPNQVMVTLEPPEMEYYEEATSSASSSSSLAPTPRAAASGEDPMPSRPRPTHAPAGPAEPPELAEQPPMSARMPLPSDRPQPAQSDMDRAAQVVDRPQLDVLQQMEVDELPADDELPVRWRHHR